MMAAASATDGAGWGEVIFDPVRHGAARVYAATIARVTLTTRARAVIVASMPDPSLRPPFRRGRVTVEVMG